MYCVAKPRKIEERKYEFGIIKRYHKSAYYRNN